MHPPAGLGGRPGRTLVAVLDTLVDLNRQVIGATLQANAELPSGSSFGGLRGGYAKLNHSTAVLRDFSFVPGVRLTATFHVKGGALQATDIRVSGMEASPGTVRFGSRSKRVTGSSGRQALRRGHRQGQAVTRGRRRMALARRDRRPARPPRAARRRIARTRRPAVVVVATLSGCRTR